jgi:sulfonate transport system ATP-binding protein
MSGGARIEARVARRVFDAGGGVEGVHLRAAPGEIVVVAGASGCGKSTLLRIVAGLDHGFDGEVRLDHERLREPSPRIGVVFQEPRLLPWLTVQENVLLATAGAEADRPRALALLDEVGLDGCAQLRPKALSGGMAQRVALARALLREPGLLLLDEPFAALDPPTRGRLQHLLLALVRERGTTVILVTHDVAEAVALADRILVLGGTPGRPVAELPLELGRPRPRASAAVVALQERVLGLLEASTASAAAVPGDW